MFDLKNQGFLLMQLFQKAQEGMIITDEKARILACNEAFCQISGFSEQELIGQNPSILSSGRQDKDFYTNMWLTIEETGFWEGEVWNRKKDGSFYAELLSVNKVSVPGTDNVHYLGMMSDITKMKEHHASLEKLAHYDALTSLPNRNLLEDRFNQAVAKANRNHEMLAVCFLDLDDFKPVNDTYGHHVGDLLLIELAERIKSQLRKEDTVSRYGGDEFVILLSEIHSRADCDAILQKLLHAVSQPYQLVEGRQITIGASIGYTLYPFDKGSLGSLIEHADQTLYQIKNAGKSAFLMYGDTEKVKEISKGSYSHAAIFSAIDDEQMRLFFQPKIDMTSGDIVGFEALVRWQHPSKGLLSPIEFLPSINESEVEVRLGHYVIREALKCLANWHSYGLKLRVSVNLSAYHLARNSFIKNLEVICNEFPDLDLSYFQIEILESHALDELSSIQTVISECEKKFNISMALDDFGTGYSSLSHIRTLSIKTIKIDQSFVRNMLNDADDYKIVESVISLANSFNIEVIAEGVESLKHAQILLCMGCKIAQGYAIARPMPSESVLDWACNFYMPEVIVIENRKNDCLRTSQLRLFMHFLEIEVEFLKSNIKSKTSSNFPLISLTHSHCGFWLKKAKSIQFIEELHVEQLENQYSKLLKFISNIHVLYQCGDRQSAQIAFQDIEEEYKTLIEAVNNLRNR
ncbi:MULTISPECIES: EAL domain-containing protein [unclassified Methylophaga]|jgi:diguanylate cyclase (GGDEF)-like protein/PAS domain S-box-containing protein|uniref:putative bifunctional diguanylate cyclase/phosphodiesterase n=2 Tax=Methylophaga TaxID=40222 RepID=UPI000C94FF6E|nr:MULTISPECIES: EAL domain-containing protein [unclassified Methylophaga]MAK65912.1 hypothetical protein [Methylophaga sp.]MAK66048.1 hypothetical protein [Methylophaga sp.]MAY18574.1 hypothetical protein [Methylophaga sp.]MAY18962.1 hypothetical protein [Methylophaga sp.]MAY18964.1 hypothetical protein [Methylophaga sp.]|tara:strand:- start:133 stop:2205 length:2073 start_codon:yes stop_codon:yes gene_type:complete